MVFCGMVSLQSAGAMSLMSPYVEMAYSAYGCKQLSVLPLVQITSCCFLLSVLVVSVCDIWMLHCVVLVLCQFPIPAHQWLMVASFCCSLQAARYLQEATSEAHISQAEAASTAQVQLDHALAASKATAAAHDDLQKAIQASEATAAAAKAAAPLWAAGLPSEEQQLAMLAAEGQLQQEQERQVATGVQSPPSAPQQQRRSFGNARPSPSMLQIDGAGFGYRPGSSGGISPGQRGKPCQGQLDREAQRLAKM